MGDWLFRCYSTTPCILLWINDYLIICIRKSSKTIIRLNHKKKYEYSPFSCFGKQKT